MCFSPKGMKCVLTIFELRITMSRYCAMIRVRYSCLCHICKENVDESLFLSSTIG